MPSFGSQVEHQLGQPAAVARLETFIDKVREQYQGQVSGLTEEWNENVLTFSFTAYGIQIQGTLTVEETAVTLDGTLPFAAIAFKGKIESSLAEELKQALAD